MIAGRPGAVAGTGASPAIDRGQGMREPGDAMRRLVVVAALAIEARMLRRGLPEAEVITSGVGRRRAELAARELRTHDAAAVAIAGVCAAVDPALAPGDVVVATELRDDGRTRACDDPRTLAEALRRRGLRVHCGPIRSCDGIVRPPEHARLRKEGVLAADMESAWIGSGAGTRPLAVLRVVSDTPGHPLALTPAMFVRGVRALLVLRRAAATLADWALAVTNTLPGPRTRSD